MNGSVIGDVAVRMVGLMVELGKNIRVCWSWSHVSFDNASSDKMKPRIVVEMGEVTIVDTQGDDPSPPPPSYLHHASAVATITEHWR